MRFTLAAAIASSLLLTQAVASYQGPRMLVRRSVNPAKRFAQADTPSTTDSAAAPETTDDGDVEVTVCDSASDSCEECFGAGYIDCGDQYCWSPDDPSTSCTEEDDTSSSASSSAAVTSSRTTSSAASPTAATEPTTSEAPNAAPTAMSWRGAAAVVAGGVFAVAL